MYNRYAAQGVVHVQHVLSKDNNKTANSRYMKMYLHEKLILFFFFPVSSSHAHRFTVPSVQQLVQHGLDVVVVLLQQLTVELAVGEPHPD